MDNKNKENKFIKYLINIGLIIYNLFLLQFLWLFYSLRGFVVLGIFPSTTAIVDVFYKIFDENYDIDVRSTFKESYHSNFKQANQVGYIVAAVLGILYIDIRVSVVYIQSIALHTALLLFTLLALVVSMYTFIVTVRYDFKTKDVIKQSFFVSLSVPIYTIAALIGIILIASLMYNYMFLFVLFGIPLFLLPLTWFTYTGLKKAEEQRDELTHE